MTTLNLSALRQNIAENAKLLGNLGIAKGGAHDWQCLLSALSDRADERYDERRKRIVESIARERGYVDGYQSQDDSFLDGVSSIDSSCDWDEDSSTSDTGGVDSAARESLDSDEKAKQICEYEKAAQSSDRRRLRQKQSVSRFGSKSAAPETSKKQGMQAAAQPHPEVDWRIEKLERLTTALLLRSARGLSRLRRMRKHVDRVQTELTRYDVAADQPRRRQQGKQGRQSWQGRKGPHASRREVAGDKSCLGGQYDQVRAHSSRGIAEAARRGTRVDASVTNTRVSLSPLSPLCPPFACAAASRLQVKPPSSGNEPLPRAISALPAHSEDAAAPAACTSRGCRTQPIAAAFAHRRRRGQSERNGRVDAGSSGDDEYVRGSCRCRGVRLMTRARGECRAAPGQQERQQMAGDAGREAMVGEGLVDEWEDDEEERGDRVLGYRQREGYTRGGSGRETWTGRGGAHELEVMLRLAAKRQPSLS